MQKELGPEELKQYLYIIGEGKESLESWTEQTKARITNAGMDLSRASALVFNANPFTIGHRYLSEIASKRSSAVIVFVIQGKPESGGKGNHENTGIEYPFEKRLLMAQESLKDLQNVLVLPSGPYIISRDDFPKDYLREEMANATAHAALDSMVFTKVCTDLGIKLAFAGDEPRDELSEIHLNALRSECAKSSIVLRVAERKRLGDRYISSALVRQAISDGDKETVKALVPPCIFDIL